MRIRWSLLLIFLSFWSNFGSAADREAIYPEWTTSVLVPWFDSQPDQFFTSKVPSDQPVQLRYRVFPRDKAWGRMVLLHGFGERIEKHMEMAYDLYELGYSVYLFDQRGFGRSTRLNPEGKDSIYVDTFHDYVKDLEQFLVEIVGAPAAEPTYIFAHSMGGLVSTLLFHDRPELVNAAVFAAPMLSIRVTNVPRSMAALLGELACDLGFGASYAFGQVGPRRLEFAQARTGSQARWQFYADFYHRPDEWPRALGGSSFRWFREAIRATILVDDDNWAAQVKTPILLFQAEHDYLVKPDGQDAFCQRAPHCQKVFVPGTHHEIYREKDEPRALFLNSLRTFLDEQDARGRGQNPATAP